MVALWPRRSKVSEFEDAGGGDAELIAGFQKVQPRAASVTMHMCWHRGSGHDYPVDVMQAAARLRDRHGSSSDDEYTSLTFRPSDDDWRNLLVVVPYCDWVYVEDVEGGLLAQGPDAR